MVAFNSDGPKKPYSDTNSDTKVDMAKIGAVQFTVLETIESKIEFDKKPDTDYKTHLFSQDITSMFGSPDPTKSKKTGAFMSAFNDYAIDLAIIVALGGDLGKDGIIKNGRIIDTNNNLIPFAERLYNSRRKLEESLEGLGLEPMSKQYHLNNTMKILSQIVVDTAKAQLSPKIG